MRVDMRRGEAILFVRAVKDLARALETVNPLLARRRATGLLHDEVLGVLVGEDLDNALHGRPRKLIGAHAALRESVGLSGIWSLCWFDVPVDRAEEDADRARRCLFDRLANAMSGDASEGPLWFPVLTPLEARGDVRALVDALRASYPMLTVMRDVLVHDPSRGLMRP